MAIDRLPDPSDPDAVGRAEFATARRGFDQIQVRSYLTVVSRELKRLKDREEELVREVESLRTQLDEAKRSASELDEAALTARLGEEMTKVLETARSAAAERVRRAEQTAEELVANATAEAERIVASAQSLVDEEVNAARQRGRELVAEARLVRERMLDDLARRRRNLRTQVEQLRAGRDRLLATHNAVRAALDEIEAEIERELPEARSAAELTGRRLQHEPTGSAAMIEMEIDDARRAGTPLVTDEEIAARVAEEPAEWVNTGAAVTEDDTDGASSDETSESSGPTTDEIPVLDHFGTGEETGPQIVLSEVGHRRKDHRDLPRDPVPVIEAPDDVEEVRVVASSIESEAADDVAAAADADASTEIGAKAETVAATESVEVDEAAHEGDAVAADAAGSGDDASAAGDAALDDAASDDAEAAEVVTDAATEAPAGDDAAAGGTDDETAADTTVAAADDAPSTERDEPAAPASAEASEPVAPAAPDTAEEDETAQEDDAAKADDTAEAAPAPAARSATKSPVDDLFARIRSSRAENVARAREVLDQPLTPPAAGTRTIVAPATAATAEATAAVADDAAVGEQAEELSPDAQRLADRDEAIAGITTVVSRKLKRLLADEQNEIQDLVRRTRGNVRREDVLGARDHHVGRYVAAVGGELLAAVSAGASFHDPDGHAKDTDLGALDERLAGELLDPLRQLLGRGVDQSAGDEDELLDRVRSAYREVKSQRVETTARVVTLAAFNLGIVEAQPEGGMLRWLVDPVQGCSPDCLDNELAGAVPAGEAFPTGDVYPPAHPGCRCLLVPADQ